MTCFVVSTYHFEFVDLIFAQLENGYKSRQEVLSLAVQIIVEGRQCTGGSEVAEGRT